ncbi:MAG: hypothetical protein ACSHX6_04850 [Akkermansiaceae bacterium]
MKLCIPQTSLKVFVLASLFSLPLVAEEVAREIQELSEENIRSGVEGRKLWGKEKKAAEPGYVCVRASGVAWIYKHPPHTGSGHGDGIASSKLSGLVVDSGFKTLKDVKFVEKPTRQFSGPDKEEERAITKKDGRFSFVVSVGAAITMGEGFGGDVYQSGFKTFVVSCEGYQTLEVTVGFGCPGLFIQMTKEHP